MLSEEGKDILRVIRVAIEAAYTIERAPFDSWDAWHKFDKALAKAIEEGKKG